MVYEVDGKVDGIPMIRFLSRGLHLGRLVLREGSLLVAQVTIGHAQRRPVEVTGVCVREMNGHVALTRHDRHHRHLTVEADGDRSSFLRVLQLRQQPPLQRLVRVVLIVHLLGEDLRLRHGLLALDMLLPSVGPLLQQPEYRLQDATYPFAAGPAPHRHLQVVQIVVQFVLVVEHVAHRGGGHVARWFPALNRF